MSASASESTTTANSARMPPDSDSSSNNINVGVEAIAKESTNKKGKKKEKASTADEALDIEDDGEFGGESLGRVVWEWFEQSLKAWEAEEKRKAPEKTESGAETATAPQASS